MSNIVLYARVSTAEQTIAHQRKQAEAAAAAVMGLHAATRPEDGRLVGDLGNGSGRYRHGGDMAGLNGV